MPIYEQMNVHNAMEYWWQLQFLVTGYYNLLITNFL